ncbi:MAG: FAD:protein FMN transferase [Nitrospira sp.]|nr:FAD:protein FMN transferase [Nitrospira sp.]TKB71686.1 MAG: FAD:protein FMN transferase [Nitrospira sp.]
MYFNLFNQSFRIRTCLMTLLCSAVAGCVGMPTGQESAVVTRAQMQMGTLVKITAVARSESIAQAAATAGFTEIHRLEELLSTWIPTSELSRVNFSAGGMPVSVSPETMTVVQGALQVAEMTGGGFNIAIGPVVDAWNVNEGRRVPTESELEDLRSLVDLRSVHADVQKQTIYLEKTGMRIDVGGIGKGYAADQAVMAMKKAGAVAGVIALSGDIKTFGRLPGGRKFPVGIQHPRKEGEVLAFIDLEDEAISTAGDYERFFERDGVRYHHILDPKTLQPARSCQSVTVVAREGIWADGLDTGIFVMGPERGMELVEQLPDIEAIIVDANGRLLVSSGLKQRIRFP